MRGQLHQERAGGESKNLVKGMKLRRGEDLDLEKVKTGMRDTNVVNLVTIFAQACPKRGGCVLCTGKAEGMVYGGSPRSDHHFKPSEWS